MREIDYNPHGCADPMNCAEHGEENRYLERIYEREPQLTLIERIWLTIKALI